MQFQLYRKPEITLETNFSDNEYRQKSNEIPISMLVRFHEIFFLKFDTYNHRRRQCNKSVNPIISMIRMDYLTYSNSYFLHHLNFYIFLQKNTFSKKTYSLCVHKRVIVRNNGSMLGLY